MVWSNYNIIRQQKGGLAVIFAVLLPFIFSVCALAFDGARILMKRARLADALNEAALVIATSSDGTGSEEEKKKNADLLKRYIGAYFPQDELKSSSVTMRTGIDSETGKTVPIYDISAQLDVKTVLPLGSLAPSFDPVIGLANNGSVRKGISTMQMPADYVFVVDFSGSMTLLADGVNEKRIDVLKKVVDTITTKSLKNEPKTKFGIVPFEKGIPVKRPFDVPGEEFGCELTMEPIPRFNIDYDFWSRMILSKNTGTDTLMRRTILHHHRYRYHLEHIMKVKGYDSMEKYAKATGICESIATLEEKKLTKYAGLNTSADFPVPYVCDFMPKDDHLNLRFIPDPRGIEANLDMIENQESAFRYLMYPTYIGTKALSGDIFHPDVVDAKQTIAKIFDKSITKSWALPDHGQQQFAVKYPATAEVTWPATLYHAQGPWGITCQSATVKDSNGKQLNYFIDLTDDLSKLTEFQKMYPKGGTTSTVGVLKGAQVLAKGTNPRKVMIVISDGEDNSTDLRDAFHKPTSGPRLCDAVRDELPNHSVNTEDVEIFFISLVGTADDVDRAKYWEDNCTGPGNSFIATNYEDLMDKLTSIVSAYEETGYFNNG
jgi:tight adherence protein G